MRSLLSLAALFISFLVLSLSLTKAAPIESNNDGHLQSLAARIAFNPTITAPKAGAIWQAGTNQTVTWKTSNIPSSLQNSTGQVKLGYKTKTGKGGLNLKWTLAKNFPLESGSVTFQVPQEIKERKDYFVVLFGDSGNTSKKFTITAA